MKLTGELKDKVESVETREEKKNIIEEAGMELTDDELDAVAGGKGIQKGNYCVICLSCGKIGANLTKPEAQALAYAHEADSKTEPHICEIRPY